MGDLAQGGDGCVLMILTSANGCGPLAGNISIWSFLLYFLSLQQLVDQAIKPLKSLSGSIL